VSDATNPAIKTSVTRALIGATLVLIPVAILTFMLAGEWPRAARAILLSLVVVPLVLVLRQRLLRGHIRQALLGMCLLNWAAFSLLLYSGGTLINPNLPLLLCLSVVGALAQDRLLSWLLPLLCATSTIGAVLLDRYQLLPHNLAPSSFALALGCLLGMGFLCLLTQITSRHLTRSHQQERDSLQRLQQLSSQLQLAITAGNITCFSLDPSNLSLQVGADACALLDCAAGEQPLQLLQTFSPKDRQRISQAVANTLADGKFPPLICQLCSGPGTDRWYRLFAARSNEQQTRLICALQDIHEQQQAELAKEHFTAMVSHELRTPLTALLGAVRLLQGLHRQSLAQSGQELLDIAMRGGERLSGLINDILDFSKLQAGRMPVPCQVQALQPMLNQALDSVQPLLQARAQQLHIEGFTSEQSAYLDSLRAQQVLINLLANAIKFSPPASPLWLRLELDDKYARISVRDSGPGIAAEFQSQLFEPFTQANMSNTRDSNSSGLGLAISRQLMRQMGGELSYSSPLGEGATFYADFLRQAPNLPTA
jgi:signal transduction histidine kinase